MGIWKDKTRKDWRYEFRYRGQRFAGGGLESRRAALAAREERRNQIAESSKLILPGMGFKEAASAYLDYSERKHAKSTYEYKKLIYKTFLQSQGDIVITDVTPANIRNYLSGLKTNALYNARRKDLSALFEWTIKTYKLPMTNPCKDVDKMPHPYKVKEVPTEEEILKLIMVARPGDEQDIINWIADLLK